MRSLIKTSLRSLRVFRPMPLFLYSTKINHSSKLSRNLIFHTKFAFPTQKQEYQNIIKSDFSGPGFYMEQLLTGCLAIYSYYIQSGKQAFLIDPLNQIQKYDEILTKRQKKLKGVFLTHYHADYIAGHLQLKKKYGCQVYIGPKGLQTHGIKVLKDGQQIKLGDIKLKTIHTPGHTQQSSCLVLIDSQNKQQCLFTGDTVFLNEVGRPDLAVKTNLTSQNLAEMLFDSLQKVKKLNDDIRIYPGHGSGSSCGKSIGKGDFCTLATQKQNNYGLKETKKQKFVKQVLHQMPNPPQYFGYNAKVNKFEPFDYDKAHQNVMKKLSANEVKQLLKKQQTILIDVRAKDDLKKGIIKDALTIDFDGAFANWAGTLLNPTDKFIIYGPKQRAKQSIKRLLRIGYLNVLGYTEDDVKNFDHYLPDYAPSVITEGRTIIDVRKPGEWAKGIVDGDVVKLQLNKIFQDHDKVLKKQKKYVIHCQGGYRARIAHSYLKSQGYDVKAFADGGYAHFEKMGIKTTLPK